MRRTRTGLIGVLLVAGVLALAPAGPGHAAPRGGGGDPVAAHWTAARQRAAIPRDLVIDERGLAFRRGAQGTLVPHGHTRGQLYATGVTKAKPSPTAKPGGNGDKTGPVITNLDPWGGKVIGASHTFKATVTDTPSGVGSVSFRITPAGGPTQTFAARAGANSVWSVDLSGFTNGSWSWQVVAKDRAKPANTSSSGTTSFSVSTGTAGGGTGTTVTNAAWTQGGAVQNATGRIYFEMPTNASMTSWGGYVCSGTVADDATSGRSVIITAAHCVYDDEHKVFARNVIFIPNQDGTTGSGTDRNCANDPIGCWTTSFGVVDRNWTTRTFPDNIAWDYAFYVVADAGAHTAGYAASSSDILDAAAGKLPVKTDAAPTVGSYTHALGYSYNMDPNFMYCAQGLGTSGTVNWWLSQCGLSGGSSGGPWIQPLTGGAGPIVSVNSWGYTNQPGMAGPKLSGTSADCVFTTAKLTGMDTDQGAVAVC